MKKIILFLFYLVLISFFIMTSCASTSLMSIWTDDMYRGGRFKNVLIVGVIQPYALREFFEDELVQQLKAKGINGVESYIIFSDETLTEQEIDSKIDELSLDSVLVARFVDIADIEAYITYPFYLSSIDLYAYYLLSCQNIISIGYDVRFETGIFEAKNGKLIWSALSETELERTPENITKSFIAAIIKDLCNKKLI